MTLTNLGVNSPTEADHPVPLSAGQFQYSFDAASGVSRLTWSLDQFAGTNSSLPDGYYQLTLDSSLISDVYGNALDGDGNGSSGGAYVLQFYRLQGDVDGNMHVDSADVNAVNAANGSSSSSTTWNANADLDRDGRVTVRDRLLVAKANGNSIVPPTAQVPVLPSDLNSNGVVDAADYVLWRKNQGHVSQPAYSAGDATGDGAVDNSDYAAWRQNFGRTQAGQETAPGVQLETAAIGSALMSEQDSVFTAGASMVADIASPTVDEGSASIKTPAQSSSPPLVARTVQLGTSASQLIESDIQPAVLASTGPLIRSTLAFTGTMTTNVLPRDLALNGLIDRADAGPMQFGEADRDNWDLHEQITDKAFEQDRFLEYSLSEGDFDSMDFTCIGTKFGKKLPFVKVT